MHPLMGVHQPQDPWGHNPTQTLASGSLQLHSLHFQDPANIPASWHSPRTTWPWPCLPACQYQLWDSLGPSVSITESQFHAPVG